MPAYLEVIWHKEREHSSTAQYSFIMVIGRIVL